MLLLAQNSIKPTKLKKVYKGQFTMFNDDVIQKVWEKGKTVPNYDSRLVRKDQCDAWIKRYDYGNRDSDYGWEIDHIKPVSQGGTDDLYNLRPLQWQNNVATQDGRLRCVVKS